MEGQFFGAFFFCFFFFFFVAPFCFSEGKKERNDTCVARKDCRAQERKKERSDEYVERKQDPKP